MNIGLNCKKISINLLDNIKKGCTKDMKFKVIISLNTEKFTVDECKEKIQEALKDVESLEFGIYSLEYRTSITIAEIAKLSTMDEVGMIF